MKELRAIIIQSIVVVTCFFALVCFMLWSDYSSRINETNNRTRFIATLLSEQALSSISELRKLTEIIQMDLQDAYLKETPELSTRGMKHLERIKNTYEYLMDILIIDSSGKIVQWTGDGEPPCVSDREYYKHHTNSRHSDVYVGDPLLSRVHKDQWFFAISKGFRSQYGDLEKVVVAIVDIEKYREKFSHLQLPEDISIAILSSSGRIIIREPDQEKYIGKQIKAMETIKNLGLLAGNVSLVSPLDGLNRIAGYQMLDNYQMGTYSSMTTRQVLDRWWFNFYASIVFLIAISSLIFFHGYRSYVQKKNILNSKFLLDEAQRIAHIGSWTFDHKYKKLSWSKETYRIFGVEPSKADPTYGLFMRTIHRDDVNEVIRVIDDSVFNKHSYMIIHRLVMNDNHIKYVRQMGSTRYDSEGNPIISQGTIQDITIQHKVNMEKERYLNLIDENVITSSTDLDGNITSVSQAFCKISGYTKEELIGKNHNIVRHKDMSETVYEELWSTITRNEIWKGEIKNLSKNGEHYWVRATITPTYDGDLNKIGYTAIRQDITDKKRAEKLSITDSLTQIYNRVHLDSVLQNHMQSSQRYRHPLSFIILDVDHFKKINDTQGHQVGDMALREISSLLAENVRGSDTLGRWGGEEFVVVLPETDLEGARSLAEKLRSEIDKRTFESVGSMSASFGVSCYRKGDTQNSIIERADQALYRAKAKGRNIVQTE